MRFSVLLPTHNRLEYLRYAVDSVRRQDDPGWEVVISDNDSADDIAGYVAALADDRVRYVRTAKFVSVTENWNNALRASTGDYIVMLGDDDALLPGYFSGLRRVIETFGSPDCIYVGALLYAYPAVLPDAPAGYLQRNLHAPFFGLSSEPFILDSAEAHALARAAMDFRVAYDFNMQYAAVSRATVTALAGEGDFFRSPFPDYYAMNLVFARAGRIAVDPRPRVIVGITKRSHGYFHFNRREDDARALLNTDDVDPEIRLSLTDVIVPGTNINTSWLLAMEAIHRRLGCREDTRPNYARYQRLQAMYCAEAYHLNRSIRRSELAAALRKLPRAQRWALAVLGPIGAIALRHTPARAKEICRSFVSRLMGLPGAGQDPPEREVGRYQNIIEVFESMDPDHDPLACAS